ncbi:MAG TPA: UbiA family prenyltransferase [Burkholderiaceae bacterium]
MMDLDRREVEPQDMSLPLVVDLDGTLILTDTVWESALVACRHQPATLFALPVWLRAGKANLKHQLAKRAEIDVPGLPWNVPVLQWLVEQHASGRKLFLATGSDLHYAKRVMEHLDIFEDVLASADGHNLTGENKRAALVARFGEGGYDYAGNSRDDLPVWRSAYRAIAVHLPIHLEKQVAIEIAKKFVRPEPRWHAWPKAMRLHQWLKNLLLFLPLLASHNLQPEIWTKAALGYLAFGLCASSVYLLNDLLDLRHDRHHPRKRQRPFASGRLPLVEGMLAAPCLGIAAFGIAFALSPPFALVLLGYYALTLVYSFVLKRIAMLDVMTLAGLYMVRILAGAALTNIVPSFWLMSFAMFFFLCLASLKRYIELVDLRTRREHKAKGRGYSVDDAPLVASQGAAAGHVAVLVLALYINSREVWDLYHEPRWLWGICLLLLYWLNRSWWLAHRGKLHDDPVAYAFSDRSSRIILLLVFGLLVLATVHIPL